MKPVYRGAAVAIVQCLVVLSVAGKYALDREHLPRVWAKTAAVDPNLPVRGRYVSLRLEVTALPNAARYSAARLSVQDGRLTATPDPAGTVHIMPAGFRAQAEGVERWLLAEPVAYFIPENVPDPSRRARDEDLWVEVSVPEKGGPRPIRLGVKKDGVLTPLQVQ